MKAIVYVLPLLTVACAHLGKTSVKNPTAQPTQPVAIAEATPSDRPATLPATYEEYYVGTMVDPDDPTFTYQPGQLLVQTRPERLRLGAPDGLLPGIDYGPVTAARMANDHPEPTATELAALVARSQRAMSALTEENQRLRAQAKPVPATQQPAGASQEAKPGAAALPSDPGDEHLNRVEPNADYVIELDPTLLAPPTPSTSNPFVQLYRPPVSWHELEIHVSAAVPGPHSTVVIDDEPYGLGERFKDLTVYRIEADAVYLRKDSFLLVCPVSERPLKLRLP